MENYTSSVLDFDTLKQREDSTLAELSYIVNQLESEDDSPQLWTTLSLQLEALSNKRKSDKYWQNEFRIAAKKVKEKKKLLQNSKNIKTEEIVTELTDLEVRILKVSEKVTEAPTICRICLILSDNVTYIFEDNNGELSTVNKLTYCNCISNLTKDDGFPQFICKNCVLLVDNAYQLKMLCKKSEETFNNEKIKQEPNVVYIFESENIIESENIFDVKEEEKMDNDDELFKEDLKNSEIIECTNQDETRIDKKLEILNETKCKRLKTKNINFRCETCGVTCKSARGLLKHTTQLHPTLKPPQCSICSKIFKVRNKLYNHMRTHTLERPYVCEICGKSYKTGNSLKVHSDTHTNLKNFKCVHCSYQCYSKTSLTIHERIHSGVQPYSCKLCSLKFSTASNMHKHIRNIHQQQQKKHKCGQCDRSFCSRESVRKHMASHTGTKIFSCAHNCTVSYAHYTSLRKHYIKQHPGLKPPKELSFRGLLPSTFQE